MQEGAYRAPQAGNSAIMKVVIPEQFRMHGEGTGESVDYILNPM